MGSQHEFTRWRLVGRAACSLANLIGIYMIRWA